MADGFSLGPDDFDRPPDAAYAEGAETGAARDFVLIPRGDLRRRRFPAPLVRGWLDQGGLSVLYGPSNSGKSTVAVGLAHAIAAGASWNQFETVAGPVIYVAAEDPVGIRDRATAIEINSPSIAGAIDREASFFMVAGHVQLSNAAAVSGFITAVSGFDASLIVFDTLARCAEGAEENSASAMASIVAGCDKIRSETGAHVMLVHHSGKDAERGARGSSALRAAVDTEIRVDRKCDVVTVETVKQRNHAPADKLTLRMRAVEIGRDATGAAVTSAVVDCAQDLAAPCLTTKNDARREAADTKARELAKLLPTGEMSTESARKALIDSGMLSGETDDARRKAAARAVDRILDLGLAEEVSDGMIFIGGRA